MSDLRAVFASMATRASGVTQRPVTCVALATIVLLFPLSSAVGPGYHLLALPQLIVIAFVGVCLGWIAFDRMAAWQTPLPVMLGVAVVVTAGLWYASTLDALQRLGLGPGASSALALSFALGASIRGVTDDRRSAASLVALASAATWLAYDIPMLPYQPLRDIHLYLNAGVTALDGASPYQIVPITSVAVLEKLPFVYPPFTIMLFEFLASLPEPLAIAIWEAGSIAAVVAGLWLVGIRGRWLVVLLAWPPLALGIAVGNVASFSFLLYVLGFRFGAALVLSGAFKVQSAIPTLWLVREWRWRELALGIGILAALAIVSVPFVGVQSWVDWPAGLRAFQESLVRFPTLRGFSLTTWHGQGPALAITVGAIGFALLARGRNALARFGLASVVGSPTLSVHGLSPLLAGVLVLGPELLWFFLGLGARGTTVLGFRSAYVAMGVAGLALLVAGIDLRLPSDLATSRADVHPAARSGQVWPDPT